MSTMRVRTQSWRRGFANLHTCLSPRQPTVRIAAPADHLLEKRQESGVGDKSSFGHYGGLALRRDCELWALIACWCGGEWGMRDAMCSVRHAIQRAMHVPSVDGWWIGVNVVTEDSSNGGSCTSTRSQVQCGDDRRFIERWILYKY